MADINIFLFVPNLIGFLRVILGIASLFFMTTQPIVAMALYWSSAFADVFDGMAARHFNQSTTFGAVLDMVSDRCTTLCLWFTCAQFYPDYVVYFQLLAILDISSHWFQMYDALTQGKTSHKLIKLDENPVLRFYYWKPVLFSLCSANELFFMAIYLLHFDIKGMDVSPTDMPLYFWELIRDISLPMMVAKHAVGLVQLYAASSNIGGADQLRHIREREAAAKNK
eukprot:m.28546 g.28546  ORF g.28546 m.28546 type:complete len:225 (+) comp9049_c0_seq2:116-790(+)